jgi:hypothetical protein
MTSLGQICQKLFLYGQTQFINGLPADGGVDIAAGIEAENNNVR